MVQPLLVSQIKQCHDRNRIRNFNQLLAYKSAYINLRDQKPRILRQGGTSSIELTGVYLNVTQELTPSLDQMPEIQISIIIKIGGEYGLWLKII